MKNNNILILFVICFLLNGFLHAADCYVLGSANPELADGSEEHPHTNISACVDELGEPDNYDTIYIGAGNYHVSNINTGKINIVGSGVNVTKIHNTSAGGDCFYNFSGTMRDLSFDRYTYFSNGGNTTAYCGTCIKTPFENGDTDPVLIYNVLFKYFSNNIVEINRDYVEIRNNVFANEYTDNNMINFGTRENLTFMNNLILRRISFYNVNNNNGTNQKFHNNLFLSNCNITNFYGSTYNLVYSGNSWDANGYTYGDQDNECGQMGEYQEDDDFGNFTDLNFLVNTWNIYNIYASGENDIMFDKGNPDTDFNDQDGSRSDIGIMGGDYPWPFSSGPIMTNFYVDPINVQIDEEINVNSRAQTE